MKLMNIKLKNVKCFDKLTLHLVKPETQEPLSVCAFVGPNGTGKSTILDSLVHIFTKASSDFGGNTFKSNAVKYKHSNLSITASFKFSPQEQKVLNYNEPFQLHHYMDDEESYFLYPPAPNALSEEERESIRQHYLTTFQTLINANTMGLIFYFDAFRYLIARNPSGPDLEDFNLDSKSGALKSNVSEEGKITNKYFNVKQWLVNLDYMILKGEKPYYQTIFNHVIKAFELLFHPLLFHGISTEGKILFKDNNSNESCSGCFKSLVCIKAYNSCLHLIYLLIKFVGCDRIWMTIAP